MVLDLVMRTLIVYTVLLVVMRIMGKREVGQLTPSDFVVAIVIAELAALPMEHKTSIINGLVPILTLMVAEIFLSWVSLKSLTFRKILSGTPTIVIAQGKIIEAALRSQRYNVHDMLSQLRDKGVASVAEVEYAILEPSGHLSVFLKSACRPVIPKDLNLCPKYEGIPMPLIVDGQIIETNLKKIRRSKPWLLELLQQHGYASHKQVLFASIDVHGELYASPKGVTLADDKWEPED